MFKVNNKDTRTTPLAIINFEQVNGGWVVCLLTLSGSSRRTKILFFIRSFRNFIFFPRVSLESPKNAC